ncbi:hypothetical protein Bbelb_086740 [Branchiostoma belcheri]|nr:hypothetical protein Bbelb_086740 [Branchiostoma belcheri]
MNWNRWDLPYAFPPFMLVALTLRKAREDRAHLLLVAPIWDTAVWYPVLLEMLVEEPVLLPRHNSLLTQPESGMPHPEGTKMQLAAWHVCGVSTTCMAFRQRLAKSSWRHGEQEHRSCMLRPGTSGVAGVINGTSIPFSAPLNKVLDFLISLYDKGFQYRTINVYRSAISTTHLPLEGQPLGSHPLVRRFMKGVFELRPALPNLSKTSQPGKVTHDIVIPSFPQDRRICPVTYLKAILFRALVEPHQAVSTSTIARWLRTVLQEAGIDTSRFTGHSTRGASVSAAARQGVSTKDILAAANWSTASTFKKFYNRPVGQTPSLTGAVLHEFRHDPSREGFGQVLETLVRTTQKSHASVLQKSEKEGVSE